MVSHSAKARNFLNSFTIILVKPQETLLLDAMFEIPGSDIGNLYKMLCSEDTF